MASPGINSIPSVSGRQPDIMPTLSGAGYGNYPVQNKTYLYSLLIHMLAAALIVAATTYVANNPEKVQQQLQSINLDLSDYVFNAGDSGAGGGGSHEKLLPSKGAMPQVSRQQFTPPTVVMRNENPKLPMAPTIVAPDIKVAPLNVGDPLMAIAGPPSNGPGGNAGIGTGTGTGIGSGGGPGCCAEGYRIGGGVSPPIPIYKPDPEYSEEARKAKYQGAVILWIVVGPDGRVHNMRVARSLGLGLDEKAMEAVRTWKFEPAKKDGQAVAVQLNIEVSFRLY